MGEHIKSQEEADHQDRGFVGLLLIGIGLVVLLLNITQSETLGFLVLPGLGIAFLAWAFYTRRFGFAIPGCILTGLGVSVFLSQRISGLEDSAMGGVVILGLGLGFLAITLVAPYFHEKRTLWPLIPAGIMALIGVPLLIGGQALNLVAWMGVLWPVILIAVGLMLLFAPRPQRD